MAYQWLIAQEDAFADSAYKGNAREAFEQAIKDRATELNQRDWLNADTDDTETF